MWIQAEEIKSTQTSRNQWTGFCANPGQSYEPRPGWGPVSASIHWAADVQHATTDDAAADVPPNDDDASQPRHVLPPDAGRAGGCPSPVSRAAAGLGGGEGGRKQEKLKKKEEKKETEKKEKKGQGGEARQSSPWMEGEVYYRDQSLY